MLKNFFKLYFLLAIVITVFAFNIETIMNFALIGNSLSELDKKSTSGPFFYIRQEFYNVPKSEWPSVISNLKKQFGYPIELKNISDVNLTTEQKEYLFENEMILTGGDFRSDLEEAEPEIWYVYLKDTDFVVRIYMSDTIGEQIDRYMKGIYYIMIKHLKNYPESDWQNRIDIYQRNYPNRINLILYSQLKFDQDKMIRLNQGKVIGFKHESAQQIYYKKIENSDFVMEIEPFGSKEMASARVLFDNFGLFLITVFALITAITLYLWMRPIWRDLKKLNLVTTTFGQGDFEARSDLPKKSAIWNLANTFNNMASRISKLITSHKDLTNAVSHELRTPLSRLRFAIEMLNEEKDEILKQEFVDSMGTDIDELELLVSELLTYARFDRENPELRYCKLNISQWLQDLTNKITAEDIDKELQIIDSIDEHSMEVTIDPKLLDRALNNLIRNALRYAKSRVDVGITIINDQCYISVDDDGAGIPENDRERILQPFTRLDYSRNRKTGGYGLGLSIVQQIIKWHNGKISIATSRYGGASFEICFPINQT